MLKKVYDDCMDLLKDKNENVSHNNLIASEVKGLKSLKKRIGAKE
jgi:hypothetical protein